MYYIMSSLPPLNYTADYFQFFGLSPGGLAHGGKDADYQVSGVWGEGGRGGGSMYYIMSSLPPLNYTADYFQFFGLSPGGLAHGGKDADYQVGGVWGWVCGEGVC